MSIRHTRARATHLINAEPRPKSGARHISTESSGKVRFVRFVDVPG